MRRSYDVLIVGGGIIGSSIAMALSQKSALTIAVVDVDLSGILSSSERNAGGVRAIWEQPINMALVRESISFYEKNRSEFGFQQKGYLWLYDEAGWEAGLARLELQQEWGLYLEILNRKEIERRFPFLDRCESVHAAIFSRQDGLINTNLLKRYYREAASNRGVTFIDRRAVSDLMVERGRVKRVLLREVESEQAVSDYLKEGVLTKEGAGEDVAVSVLVNAAGAWAPRLARLYGRGVPSVPIRRQVSVSHSQTADLSPYGMTVDTTGLYFHHDGPNIVAGYSIPTEPIGYRFEHDGIDFFVSEIWPRLSALSSHFESLKYLTGWAGLYEVSPDKSAMIGRVDGIENLFEAHSFSGRGVMQSYAAGKALSELILLGRYKTIDVTSLSGDRFLKGLPVPEGLHI